MVPQVNEHLGIFHDSKFSFESHLNNKIITAKNGIGIINYHSKFLLLNRIVPRLNSQTNLGVILDYLLEKVESTQYQSAFASTSTWQRFYWCKLYEELGWETV